MVKSKTGHKAAVTSAIVLALLLAGATWLLWDHLRFSWLFESLDKNTQGYPEYRHRRTGIVMVRLPGGTFWMGAQKEDPKAPNYDPDTDRTIGEDKVHQVTLSLLLIGKYEVTQAQWEAVMGSNPSQFQGRNVLAGVDARTLPVDSVYRDELVAEDGFLARTGLRLPTEAQWEYACRAGKEGPVPGTGNLDEMAWYDEKPTNPNSPIVFPRIPTPPPLGKTHPVGTKKPNDFGLYDVLGNVEEWCADTFNNMYYYESAGVKDPLCTTGSTDGVFRGGSWGDTYESCRSAQRSGWRTDESRDSTLGFRVCYYPLLLSTGSVPASTPGSAFLPWKWDGLLPTTASHSACDLPIRKGLRVTWCTTHSPPPARSVFGS